MSGDADNLNDNFRRLLNALNANLQDGGNPPLFLPSSELTPLVGLGDNGRRPRASLSLGDLQSHG